MTRRAIGTYVALALMISWGIQIPAIVLLGLDDPITRLLSDLVMWSPTLAAFVVMARSRDARYGVRWRLGKLRYLPVRIGVETAIAFAPLGILVLAGVATSGWFTFDANGVSIAAGPWVLGRGMQG